MAEVEIETIDLDMDDSCDETSAIDNTKLAETKKEHGNQQYKLKQYSKAAALYSEAIELCPKNPAYYGNRSAAYMMMGNYALALEDARKSIKIDPLFVKGWIRVAKCFMAVGDLTAAEGALNKVKEIDSKNTSYLQEMKNLEVVSRFDQEANKAFAKNDYRKAVFCLDRALDVGGSCVRFKLLKAECLVMLNRLQEAQELTNEILATDKMNSDALLVRGMCLYYQDQIDMAFAHFQQVLRLAPEHAKATTIYKKAKSLKQKKEEGNTAFKEDRLADALRLYTEALAIDPVNKVTNAKLYFNRATVHSKLNKMEAAVEDCTNALAMDSNYLKALMRRGKCYMQLGKYEEAERDFEAAHRLEISGPHSHEIRNYMLDAKRELKKARRKDYYKILGVEKTASTDDIKRAYRKRALVHHPDRHANASDDEKKEQEKMFKEVGEAYTILSDPSKRKRYDNGQDLDELNSGPDLDPHAMFQAFFPGGAQQFFSQDFHSGTSFTFSFG